MALDASVDSYDVVIIGGGLVGGSLACALGAAGLKVCVIEAVAEDARAQPSYDERVIALSWGSRLILEGIGLWSALDDGAAPIRQVHVSDRGHFGFARLDHRDEGVEALGYVVPAALLGRAIRAGLSRVDVFCPARLVGFRVQAHGVDMEMVLNRDSRLLRGRLLVGADGGDSSIRRRLGFSVQERNYGYDALITTVKVDRPRPGVAFERFTDTGPLAMLPMRDGRYSVVWTTAERERDALLSLGDEAFVRRLQARFGYRLGRLSQPGRRLTYPLKLLLARAPVRERVALIGNAAHTLHPVAGQGLNLGLRDVALLAEVLVDAVRAGRDPGGASALEHYRRQRGRDQASVASATDALARLFVNPWLPLRIARDLGMVGVDLLPGIRQLLLRRFMGLGNARPRLGLGLTLDRPRRGKGRFDSGT
jgi:2-octaprenyl-6-methoxyphenol hydroxylase